MNKILKLIIFNIIAIALGIGLGFANIALGVIIAAILLIAGNILLLKKKKAPVEKKTDPADEIEKLLRGQGYSVNFNELQSKALKQLNRAKNGTKNAMEAVDTRFQAGSITSDRYKEIVSAAYSAELDNLKLIAEQFKLLNNTDYRAFKNAATASTVSEEQVETIKRITATVDETYKRNEELIFRVDTMAANLHEMAQDEGKSTGSVTEEITELTEQLKFYQQGI